MWDEYANYQPFTICTCACICGSKSSQLDAHHKEHVFRFLMGLHDGYGHVISQILLIEPLSSLSKVCSLILQEEKMRNIGHNFNMIQSSDAVAMYVNNGRVFLGHQGQKNGGKGANGKKDRPVCTYCGFTRHIADKCYKLHGYPLGYKPKEGNKPMANQVGFDPNASFLPGGMNSVFLPGEAMQEIGRAHV